MKKIMFNDKYGLTQAVLDGRKTQTRRIAYVSRYEFEVVNYEYPSAPLDLRKSILNRSKYKINEIISIAQSYKDCGYKIKQYETSRDECFGFLYGCGVDEIPMKWPINGYNNKMFVKTELMPHQIRITNVRIERLQDISEDDCLAEGIERLPDGSGFKPYAFYDKSIKVKSEKEGVNYGWYRSYDTPRKAYAALIDKVSGKGTWDKNPYVFVYDFELVK